MVRAHVLLALHRDQAPSGLAAALAELGLDVRVSRSMDETWEAAHQGCDLILLDPAERSAHADEIRRLLALSAEPGGPGLVVFTDEPAFLVGGLEVIADYLPPDLAPQRAAARLRFALDRHQKQRARIEQLEQASLTDFKTELSNDRHFATCCRHEAQRAARHGTPLGVLILDIDEFKELNDSLGHDFGDFVLLTIARNVRSAIREFDTAARIGGDELGVLLPDTTLSHAIAVAERIRSTIAGLELEREGRRARCTVSIGVGCYDPARQPGSFEALVTGVDQALLRAKREGRNRLGVHRDAAALSEDAPSRPARSPAP